MNGSTPSFTVSQTNSESGILVGGWSNPQRAIDSDLGQPAVLSFVTLNLGSTGTASLTVADNAATPNTYSVGNFAGFLIASNLINLNALTGITIQTYLNTTLQETSTAGSLVGLNSSLISNSFEVGIYTTKPFNNIVLTISSAAGLGSYSVYHAVMRGYCAGPALTCNTPTPLNSPTYPSIVDPARTGFGGLLNVGSINNADNAISPSTTDFATLAITTSAAGTGSFAIKNATGDDYPATTFAGFDVDLSTLLTANVAGTASITLYNNGSAVQTSSGNSLLVGATTALLSGRSRQTVGVIATAAFDEVQINFTQVAGLSLGTINIYETVIQRNCAATIACNTAYSLNTPVFPVIINSERTGVTGAIGANTTIQDPYNVISASTTDFARITNTASAAATASISVLDAVDTYPVGTFAGFALRRITGVVNANLFANLTITTYLDGAQQEVRSGGSLLDLSVSLFASSSFVNAGFITTKPFDEIRLSVTPLVGADVALLGGGIDVFGAFVDTRTSTGTGFICFVDSKPDFNATNKNQSVSGSVSANDAAPVGTTYGTPVSATQPAGATPSLTFNADGTYTFNAATPGVYGYNVPVCAPNQVGPCPNQTLTITVLDPTANANKPVANTDLASTTATAPVTVNVRANDGPGNAGGALGVPTIIAVPANGVAVITNGNLVYTANPGFFGTDQVTYQVCETPGNQCATAVVNVNVKPQGSLNTTLAADDYVKAAPGTAATGNVSTNDTDPEGNTQTVTAQNLTLPGKGSFVLTPTGSYTFTPAAGFTGPVDFVYVTCDNGTPSGCATGTLHALVDPAIPVTYPDFGVTNKNQPATGSVNTNDVVPVGTTYGTPVSVTQPTGATPSLTLGPDGTYSFSTTTPGVYVYSVPVCVPGQTSNCPTQLLTITVLDPAVTTNKPVVNTDIATTTGTNPVTVNVKVNDGPGNKDGSLGTPTIATPPTNGSAVVDGSGNVVYTPNSGFTGTDVLTYQVCESPGSLCGTAVVSITVKPQGSANTTLAADDYVKAAPGTAATGNVSTNDTDPEGNTQTVTAQNITVPGKGSFVLTPTGSYTFTPVSGFSGPVDFVYTTCDNATSSTCATGTLHALVERGLPDLTPTIDLPQANFASSGANATRNLTVGLYELLGQTTSSGNVVFTITAPFGYNITFDNTLTSINVSGRGTVAVANTNWTVTSNNGLQLQLTMNTGQLISANGAAVIGFTVTRTFANANSSANITVSVTNDTNNQYDSVPANNVFARVINAL